MLSSEAPRPLRAQMSIIENIHKRFICELVAAEVANPSVIELEKPSDFWNLIAASLLRKHRLSRTGTQCKYWFTQCRREGWATVDERNHIRRCKRRWIGKRNAEERGDVEMGGSEEAQGSVRPDTEETEVMIEEDGKEGEFGGVQLGPLSLRQK